MNTLHIKNMVCPRCIETVKDIFHGMEIYVQHIKLGEVVTEESITATQKQLLSDKLKAKGFELLQDQKAQLIEKIKAIIIEQIHHAETSLHVNFSTLLSEKLHHEYTSLSRLFSTVEGITIERYILKQKIEKVKEFIFYDEYTLSEIAYKMNYSSVAHLSAQFKKETGMTPSEFKKLKSPERKSLDSL